MTFDVEPVYCPWCLEMLVGGFRNHKCRDGGAAFRALHPMPRPRAPTPPPVNEDK